ncbi:hypothetical protein ABZ686_08060 [Streptomyces sp. NPDC006992]|uniref:hypothetical protein n=1 Tax=unclassified Streptomyces TaxID=2593676 RepID=UPI0033E401E9
MSADGRRGVPRIGCRQTGVAGRRYVAMEAYGLLTGVHDCDDAFCQAVEAERDDAGRSRGPLGEQWEVRSEAEAARKLPRLSAVFPLGPLAR